MLQDENLTSRRGGTTSTWDSGIGGLSSTSNIASQLEGEGQNRRLLKSTSEFSCLNVGAVEWLVYCSDPVSLSLQTQTVFVWSRTACLTVERTTWRTECSSPSGCRSMRSTTSSCTICWTLRPRCSRGRESRCGSVTTSRVTPT